MKGKPGGAQPRPSLGVDRDMGIVDRDPDRVIGQLLAVAQRRHDLGHRQHGVAAAAQLLQMRRELVDRDRARRVGVVAEMLVGEDHGRRRRLGGAAGRARSPQRLGQRLDQQLGQRQAEQGAAGLPNAGLSHPSSAAASARSL
ncbi:MAG: hypothetical protein WDO24_26880 [Pseudomonadota bacterium]